MYRNPVTSQYILDFKKCPIEGENASQEAEIANGIYGADTVTANYMQFWFRRFRSGIFYFKDAPRTGRPVFENVDEITEIIEVDRHQGQCDTHTSRIATDWLQEHSSEFRYFRWPPKSPDMNIIEYIWDTLQRANHKRPPSPLTPID
ncbi:histone-lysine N-methyltransferase SETMAR [Trichonephila clavipes]|nr:histone-lysine N-methyltransferase SETMAR [Trichonephila clavipes]